MIALGVALAGDVFDDGHSSAPPASAPSSAATRRRREETRRRPSRPRQRTQRTGAELLTGLPRRRRGVHRPRRHPPAEEARQPPVRRRPRHEARLARARRGRARHGRDLRRLRLERLPRRPCGSGAECQRQDRSTGSRPRSSHWDGSTTVVVDTGHGDGGDHRQRAVRQQLARSRVGDGHPLDDLVRAAADERLTPATPQQLHNASTSMGFPEIDDFNQLGEGASENPVPAAPQ